MGITYVTDEGCRIEQWFHDPSIHHCSFGNREQNADQVISHQLVALQQQRHHLLGPLVDLIRVVGLDGGCAAEGVYSNGHGTRVYGRAAPPTRQLTTELPSDRSDVAADVVVDGVNIVRAITQVPVGTGEPVS